MLYNEAAMNVNFLTLDDMSEYCKVFMSLQTWANADQELLYQSKKGILMMLFGLK